MGKMKLAACGVDCSACAQYKATMEQDAEAAESLVGWFRSQGWIGIHEGAEAVMKKAPLCKGCWDITDDCFWSCGCGSVDFRICCKERNIDHCGACSAFPCESYQTWASWNDSHKKAMAYLLSLKEGIDA